MKVELKALGFLIFWLPGFVCAEIEQQDLMTLYLRGDLRNAQPGILTANGVYDFNTAWGTVEAAARVGTFTNQPGLWSYKLEGISPEFFGNHRLALRVVKNNYYESSGSSQDTMVAQRITGSYQPFGSFPFLKETSLDMSAGIAEDFVGAKGANVLPNGHGSLSLVPLWLLKLGFLEQGAHRRYLLSYGNFDIFDPYPASQPYVQMEVQQKLGEINYYSYVRYRWEDSMDRFYSLYLTLGMELPR